MSKAINTNKINRNFCTAGILSLLFACFLVQPSYASISVSTDAASHASVHFAGTISAGCYQVRVGPSSGTYTTQTSEPVCDTTIALGMGGLDVGTTYHYVVDRYNAITDMSPAETSADATFTTSASPTPHPASPTAPTVFTPSVPDTTGYTIVSMACVADHWVAASNVSNPGDWSGNVSMGDSLQTVINTIYYGTVVEFAQSTTCGVPNSGAPFYNGVQLPAKSTDVMGRKIVLRTHSNAVTDFPPAGIRITTPGKLALLKALNPNQESVQTTTGQIFQCYNTDCHDYYITQLGFTVDTTVNPAGSVDPTPWGCFVEINPLSSAHPHDIVLDQVYSDIATPERMYCNYALGGSNVALVNSYVGSDSWLPGVYPTITVTAAGGTITVPAGETWAYNALMGSTYGTAVQSTVSVAGTGTVTGWEDSASPGTNGLTIGYTGISAPTCGGGGCTVVSGEVVPTTAFKLFTASVSGGTATITHTYTSTAPVELSRFQIWKPFGVYFFWGDGITVDNNYMRASGQTLYADANAGVDLVNVAITRNYFDIPSSRAFYSALWDGYNYTFRNAAELKTANKMKVDGNIFNGAVRYQNSGFVVLVPGSWPGPGTHDVLVSNNTMRHIPAGVAVYGGGANYPPDSPTASRIKFANNIFQDVNQDVYTAQGGAPTLNSGYVTVTPGVEDLIIDHNTGMDILGIGPFVLLYGAAGEGQTVLAEGFGYTNNLFAMTKRTWTTQIVCAGGTKYAPHQPSPLIDCSTGTLADMMGTFWMRNGTPNYSLTSNYFIGDKKCTVNCSLGDANPTYVDMDSTDVSTYSSGFPSGNTFPSNNTLAARQAAIGWNATTYSASGCGGCGADVTVLPAAQGTTLNITPGVPTSTTEGVTYTAPDTGNCYVEWSTDSFATVLGRIDDGGGSTSRSVSITGLSPATAYSGRALCHYEQTTGMEFSSTSLTTFTFMTSSDSAGSMLSGKVSVSGRVTIH